MSTEQSTNERGEEKSNQCFNSGKTVNAFEALNKMLKKELPIES